MNFLVSSVLWNRILCFDFAQRFLGTTILCCRLKPKKSYITGLFWSFISGLYSLGNLFFMKRFLLRAAIKRIPTFAAPILCPLHFQVFIYWKPLFVEMLFFWKFINIINFFFLWNLYLNKDFIPKNYMLLLIKNFFLQQLFPGWLFLKETAVVNLLSAGCISWGTDFILF